MISSLIDYAKKEPARVVLAIVLILVAGGIMVGGNLVGGAAVLLGMILVFYKKEKE